MKTVRALIGGSLVLAAVMGGTLSCRKDAPPPAATQPVTEAPVPEYVCQWTDGPITIDGNADEAAWQSAPVIDKFVVPWVAPDKRPRNATRAKILWDREYLYFYADMDDPDLCAVETKHNGKVWEDDTFEMFLKPADDRPGYYEFEVNALNTHFDLFFPERGGNGFGDLNKSHPVRFDSAVKLRGKVGAHTDKGGWSVEGRVRWADLSSTGGRPAVDEKWHFAFCRCDYTTGQKEYDLSTIGHMKMVSFHHYEDYPLLRFAGPAGPKTYGIDKRIPWTNSHLVGYPDPLPPLTIVKAFPKLPKIQGPIFITEEPGTDDLLIVQHLGNWNGPAKIIRVKNTPDADKSPTVFESSNEIVYDICFHPKYLENGYVYLSSNTPLTGDQRFIHVCRYTMDRKTGKLDPKSKLLILDWESNGHNGAAQAFGKDGMFYLTTGDTSSDSDKLSRGQDLTRISSALLRLDLDHPDAGKNYGIPKDNPMIGKPAFADARPEIYAHGFRNPWRMTIDPRTQAIWVTQNGQDLWEQVYVVHPLENYGWPVYEGSHSFHAHRKLETRTKYTLPTIEHGHNEARSLTGGIVYYGAKYPELEGAYVYGDFSTGRIWAAKHDGTKITWHKEIARTTAQIINIYADKNGEIFVGDESGGVWKIDRLPPDRTLPKFPRMLSETGLFVDTAAHRPDPGLIPYDVNAPLWSDAAIKTRFIGLPGETQIDHTGWRGWNFPEGGLAVKTFEMEMEQGNPASRRRLETRVVLKQGGQWAGYTYIWNEAQTDAALAPTDGLDEKLTIKDPAAPGGVRQQTWHYPSRAECLYCHSRAANFVLGISDVQLNRDFDYGGGRVDNQLRTFEHLGILRDNYMGYGRGLLVADAMKAGMTQEKANEVAGKLADTTGQRASPFSTLLAQPPKDLPRLVDPADAGLDINARAKSYLHANCAHCHVEAGGGNASVNLEFNTPADKASLFDAPAQSNLLPAPDAKLIAMGHPEKSNVLHRMAIRGTGQMPPVGSNLIDEQGTALVKEWIRRMPASTQPVK